MDYVLDILSFSPLVGMATIIWLLWRILRMIKIIENKIEHHENRPKNDRFWGYGKKK